MVTGERTVSQSLKSASYACAEGAIAAGCRFYADYPAEPSIEVAEHMSRRLPQIGGHYLQMEDQTASVAAALGASTGGLKSMAAVSGPELSATISGNIVLDVMAEAPCVLLNIQSGEADGCLLGLAGQGETANRRSS